MDCGTGIWDCNSILAPEPMLAESDNKAWQSIFIANLALNLC